MTDKHQRNEFGEYLRVTLKAVEDHNFVIAHTLAHPRPPTPKVGELSGVVFCHGDIVADVRKVYEITTEGGRRYARTIRYAYNARYNDGREILRYDNAHQYRGHPTRHHRHEYGPGDEDDKITHVGENWPHLSEVLDELQRMAWGEE